MLLVLVIAGLRRTFRTHIVIVSHTDNHECLPHYHLQTASSHQARDGLAMAASDKLVAGRNIAGWYAEATLAIPYNHTDRHQWPMRPPHHEILPLESVSVVEIRYAHVDE